MLNTLISLQAELAPLLTGQNSEAAAESISKFSTDMEELKSMSFHDLISRLAESAVTFCINLAVAILVFYIGRFIIRKIYRLVSNIFIHRSIDKSLATFVLSLINMVMYFILIVTVIGILGIETTSFLALFASAGVAIGMALSGTLQNFAGGVLILLLKPYKIGDYIEAQGYAGTVSEIQIFFTIIRTPDNKSISIPNGGLSTSSVNNWTREPYRRVQWVVSISYGDDVNAARKAILDMFDADERIMPELPTEAIVVGGDGTAVVTAESQEAAATNGANTGVDEPNVAPKEGFFSRLIYHHRRTRKAINQWEERREAQVQALLPKPDYSPKVFVKELGQSSVDLTIRAWVKTSDYWNVFYYYNERFYTSLPEAGIHFPFPQMDVHVKN